MKNILITLVIISSITFTPIINTQQRESTRRKIGFFFLHTTCVLGGSALATGSAILGWLSLITKKNLENYDKPQEIREMNGVIAISATTSVAGLGLVVYGLNGLVKDIKNII